MIRKQSASKAISILQFSKRRISNDVEKALRSAIANAENNHSLDIDKLITRPLRISLMEKGNIELKIYDARCIQIKLGNLNILEFSFAPM